METKNLRWYHYACLIIGIIGVFFGPWLFTHPYLLSWDSFDFSQTGEIGDTIGGITAPIVGLISILLLWWTLTEQLKFNKEQTKFNDANRILSMETHLLHLDDYLHFGPTDSKNTIQCNGITDLKRLFDGSIENVGIAANELEKTIDHVHIIDTAASSLISFLNQSGLDIQEKKASYTMAEMYLSNISDFYGKVAEGQVQIFFPDSELNGGQSGKKRQDEIKKNCSAYNKAIKDILSAKKSVLDDSRRTID